MAHKEAGGTVEEIVGSTRKPIQDVLPIETSGGQWGYIHNRGEFTPHTSKLLESLTVEREVRNNG